MRRVLTSAIMLILSVNILSASINPVAGVVGTVPSTTNTFQQISSYVKGFNKTFRRPDPTDGGYIVLADGQVPQDGGPKSLSVGHLDNGVITNSLGETLSYEIAVIEHSIWIDIYIAKIHNYDLYDKGTIQFKEGTSDYQVIMYFSDLTDVKNVAKSLNLKGSVSVTENWDGGQGNSINFEISCENGYKSSITSAQITSTGNTFDLQNFTKELVGSIDVRTTYKKSKDKTQPTVNIYPVSRTHQPISTTTLSHTTMGGYDFPYRLVMKSKTLNGKNNITVGAGKKFKSEQTERVGKDTYYTIQYDLYAQPSGNYDTAPAGLYDSYVVVDIISPK